MILLDASSTQKDQKTPQGIFRLIMKQINLRVLLSIGNTSVYYKYYRIYENSYYILILPKGAKNSARCVALNHEAN